MPDRVPRWLDPLVVLLAMGLFQVVVGALALSRYWGLQQSLGLDNAYFLQRVWQAAFLDEPARTLLNTEVGEGLIAGRHVEPVLVGAIPWVRAWGMEGLLLFQTTLFGLLGPGAWRLARGEGVGRGASLLFAVGALLLPALWAMATLDFRTLGLAVPLSVCALALLREERWGLGLLAGLAALSCREEVGWLLLACVPWLGWRTRRGGALLLGLSGLWLGGLAMWRQGVSEFARPALLQQLPGLAERIGPVNEALWEAVGAVGLAVVMAPLAALPALGTWMMAGLVEGLWSPSSPHLLAGVWVGLLLAGASLLGRLARWKGRAALGVAALWVAWGGIGVEERFGGALPSAGAVLSGDRRPVLLVGTPWDVFRRVPPEVPVLTEAWFVAPLAARPVIYAADDWHDPAAQEQVMDAVSWAVLRAGHAWVPRMEARGWRAVASGGNARLYRREEPAPLAELNPIPPGELVVSQGEVHEGCPVGMIRVEGGRFLLGETDPVWLDRYRGTVLPAVEVELEDYCIDRHPFPGRAGAPWPADGLMWRQLDTLEQKLAEHGRRLCRVSELVLGAAGPDNARQISGAELQRELCEPDDRHPSRPMGGYPDCVSPLGLMDVPVRSSWARLDAEWAAVLEPPAPFLDDRVVWGGTAREDTFYAPSNFGVHGHGEGETEAFADDGLRVCADVGVVDAAAEARWSGEMGRIVEGGFAGWLED